VPGPVLVPAGSRQPPRRCHPPEIRSPLGRPSRAARRDGSR
jgi:hypothetical protein